MRLSLLGVSLCVCLAGCESGYRGAENAYFAAYSELHRVNAARPADPAEVLRARQATDAALARATELADKALDAPLSRIAGSVRTTREASYRVALWTRRAIVAHGRDANTADILEVMAAPIGGQLSPTDRLAAYRRDRVAGLSHAEAMRRIAIRGVAPVSAARTSLEPLHSN